MIQWIVENGIDAYLFLCVATLFMAVCWLGVELSALRHRYERFGVETAEIFKELYEIIGDQENRLVAAGQPRGRVAPSHRVKV